MITHDNISDQGFVFMFQSRLTDLITYRKGIHYIDLASEKFYIRQKDNLGDKVLFEGTLNNAKELENILQYVGINQRKMWE